MIATKVLQRVSDILVAVNPDMTARALQVFCAVARDEGLRVSDYGKSLGMPVQTVSRILLDLSEGTRSQRKAGGGLLIRKDSPNNLREKLYVLAPKGSGLLYQITKEIRELTPT